MAMSSLSTDNGFIDGCSLQVADVSGDTTAGHVASLAVAVRRPRGSPSASATSADQPGALQNGGTTTSSLAGSALHSASLATATRRRASRFFVST